VDNGDRERETEGMLPPGAVRRRMEQTLNAAYGEGLLSQRTLLQRLHVLLANELVEPRSLVGDLTFRPPLRARERVLDRLSAALRRMASWSDPAPATLLALDWSGTRDELLVGRHDACDVVVGHPSVSRKHARLSFRDGHWVLRDLDSTNGTRVNGKRVVRCRLEPGDRLSLGSADLRVD
jgi:FHA domain